ncbi:MAG TPA: recombinase family protein [Anaerolineales bacterium]|nr:recombinase family protein [Anaerolineales bacterium]
MKDILPPPSTLRPGSVVWAYLRDSGGDSQEQSVGQQREVILSYCAKYGLSLARIFCDEAKTGGTDKGRDYFAEMIDAAGRPESRAAGLLIWSLSRFARNQNDSPYYRAILRKRGLVIHSLTEVLPDDPTAIVIEAVYDFTNAEKLRQTSRDVKRGHAWLIRQGYAPGGVPPRGYKAVREVVDNKRDGSPRIAPRWVEDPEYWELGKQAWQKMAGGVSYDDLQKLTGGKFFRTRQHWSHFFRNRAYLGVFMWGGEEYPDHHPAMVDRETWDRVQARLKLNDTRLQEGSPNHPRRVHSPSLLSGAAVCMHCGSAICYRPYDKPDRARPWPHYLCGRKVSRGLKACIGKRIAARRADQAVLDGVIGQVFTEDMIADLLAEVQRQLADTEALDREARRIDKQIAECKRSIRNLLELAKSFGAQSAGTEMVKCEAELTRLQYERRQVDEQRKAAEIEVTPEALVAVLAQWRGELAQARAAGNVLVTRGLLSRFVSRIELGYNRARVTYSFPIDGQSDILEAPRRGRTLTGRESL